MDKLTIKQREYLEKANHRWNIKSGATRAGKTYLDYLVIPMRIRSMTGLDGDYVILGVTQATIERNILGPMRRIWGEKMIGEIIQGKGYATLFGEKVHCLGAEKISQAKKLRGMGIKYCYGDEVAEWSEEVFTLLKSRLDEGYSKFDGTLNPQHPTHWLKKFLDSGADIYLQQYTIFDNSFLDPEFVKNLCKEYEGTVYYDRYILGLWKRAEGAIYRKFADKPRAFRCEFTRVVKEDSAIKQFAFSDIAKITMGVDFGGNKSGHSFVASAIIGDHEDLVPLASERHFGEYDSNDIDRLAIEFAQMVEDKYGTIDFVYWDNAETVLGRGLKKAFSNVMPDTIVRGAVKDRIKNRIDCTVRLMGAGRFFYTDDCKTLESALSDAVWNDKKMEDERLDDGSTDIDSLDSFEYTFERDMKRFITRG